MATLTIAFRNRFIFKLFKFIYQKSKRNGKILKTILSRYLSTIKNKDIMTNNYEKKACNAC